MEHFFSWLIGFLQDNGVPFHKGDRKLVSMGYNFRFCNIGENPDLGLNDVPIWEDLWLNKQEIVKSKVIGKLGLLVRVPARLCIVKRITKITADAFLLENHLQGSTNSKVKYGIFLPSKYYRVLETAPITDELLLGVMTFSGARNFRDGTQSYELLRYCTLKNYSIQGGFTKVLKQFIIEREPGTIMTYVDLDWYGGLNYEKLGFKEEGVLSSIFYNIDEFGERIKVESGESYDVFGKGSLKMIWTKK